jgi:hypothetical protein
MRILEQDIKLLSVSARILNREGFETHRAEVAIYRDTDGDEYIRVGSTLFFRKDVLESDDRFECLTSGMTILL